MATTKQEMKMPDEVIEDAAPVEVAAVTPDPDYTSIVTPEMKKAAEADLVRVEEEAAKPKLRTFKRGERAVRLYVSDLFEFPEDFDLEGIGPVSYLAQPEGAITGSVDTQTFSIKEQLLKGLQFEEPARPLEQGRALRVVKALKPNGVLAQLPFEAQINNGAAGDVIDALGIRHYMRKWGKAGIIFMNMDTLVPVYCFARNCHAAAMVPALAERYPEHIDVIDSGYCSWEHLQFTEPNLAAQLRGGGVFSRNATTTRTWQRTQ